MHRTPARLETFDLVVFSYAAFIVLLILVFFPRIPQAGTILVVHAAVVCAAAALIALAPRYRGRAWRIARDWYPVVLVALAFRELHYLVHPIHPNDWDFRLMEWDQKLFGVNPTVALERFLHPFLVEVLQICYAGYYFLPAILGFVLYRKGRRAEYTEGMAVIMLTFFASYVGYFIIPARSPSFHDVEMGHTRLWGVDPATLGYGLAQPIRETLLALELPMRDCFPSGHTAITLVTLVCAWRFHKPTFWALLAPAAGLLISTVYLRHHYTVDVLAGIVLFAAAAWAGPRLHRAWERYRAKNRPETALPARG